MESIDVGTIKNLERTYMDVIWKWFSDPIFLKKISEIEKYIVRNYKELNELWQVKNKIRLGLERLLMHYAFKNLEITDIYASPLSSDLSFFTEDALINVDAKTIDLEGNAIDESYVQFQPHQVSFENIPLLGQNVAGHEFKGIKFKPGLPAIEPATKLPCLTFFLCIIYRDDGKSFSIERASLYCVPNGEIVKADFKNDMIFNFKTYRYLGKQEASKLDKEYLPKPKSFRIPSHWKPFRLRGGSGAPDSFLDTKLKNPFFKDEFAIWRIVDNNYEICLGGDSTRIEPKKIENRTDSSGEPWKGARYINLKKLL